MKTIARTLVLALTVAMACTGCVIVPENSPPGHSSSAPGKKTVYVCSVCGKRKATASASGQAPSCHGRKMSPAR